MGMKNENKLFYRSTAPHAILVACRHVMISWLQCLANNCKCTDYFLWKWKTKNICFTALLRLDHVVHHSCGMLLAILVACCSPFLWGFADYSVMPIIVNTLILFYGNEYRKIFFLAPFCRASCCSSSCGMLLAILVACCSPFWWWFADYSVMPMTANALILFLWEWKTKNIFLPLCLMPFL